MAEENKGFDGERSTERWKRRCQRRGKTWKQVAAETGVSASTLTRMAQGRRPDAASLAALSAWAGINPSDFVEAPYKVARTESITQISALLRTDPNLDAESAEAWKPSSRPLTSGCEKREATPSGDSRLELPVSTLGSLEHRRSSTISTISGMTSSVIACSKSSSALGSTGFRPSISSNTPSFFLLIHLSAPVNTKR